MNFSPRSRERFFALWIAASLVLFLIIFRMITGAGFGFQNNFSGTDNETFPSGFLHNLNDNLQYVAYAEQASHGFWLFSDPYTTESHPRLYFNLYFLLVGKISRATGIPVVTILILAGIAAAATIVLISFHTAINLGFPESAAKWSCLFVAYASGVYSVARVLRHFSGTELQVVGADVLYQDAILFSTFVAYPYHTVALMLMVLLIDCIVACQNKRVLNQTYLFYFIPFLAIVLSLSRPFEITMLLVTYCLFVGIMHARDGTSSGQRLLILMMVAIGAVPSLVYYYWLAQQPVWNYIATWLNLPEPPTFWLIGYGTMLPLALVGGWHCMRNKHYSNGLWFAVWVCMLILLLVVFRIPQTKVCSGGHFPMCVLAGLGFSHIVERLLRAKKHSLRLLCYSAIVVLMIATFGTSCALVMRVYQPGMCDSGVRRALEHIGHSAASTQCSPKVLCDRNVGIVAPALACVRVFVGHCFSTPQLETKQRKLMEAGVELLDGRSAHVNASRQVFQELINQEQFDYVILFAESPSESYARNSDNMRLLGHYGHYVLYEMTGHKIAK